jgi:quaternary ammonium compound-resistance protein SugE
MAWVVLVVAGVFEVGWAVCLKYSKGFTQLWPTLGFGFFMFLSVYLLGVALKSLPLGTAYTIWTGIGAIGTVILGILLLGEPTDLRRMACISLILAGIIGLKLISPH